VLFEVGRHHLGDPQFTRWKGTGGDVFKVPGEGFFSSDAIALAAACANFSLSVEDCPDGPSAFAASEVESRGLAGVRHCSPSSPFAINSAIAASVTRNLPR
jgi:hypothetical protein